MKDITFVTFFYDINRKNWNNFSRSVEEYLLAFTYFKNFDYKMIVFIDKRYYEKLIEYCNGIPENMKFIIIDEDWLQNYIWAWKRIKREIDIMKSDEYKSLIPERIANNYPENINPYYTILTHSKIDIVNFVIDNQLTEDEYLVWIDFGYFHDKIDNRYIPKTKMLDINKFDLDRVNLCAINAIDEKDKDIIRTLQNAPEKIGAYFFFGNRKNLKEFQNLCHKWLFKFQEMNIADDEQHLWLQCYFEDSELFKVWNFGYWHQALRYFSK